MIYKIVSFPNPCSSQPGRGVCVQGRPAATALLAEGAFQAYPACGNIMIRLIPDLERSVSSA